MFAFGISAGPNIVGPLFDGDFGWHSLAFFLVMWLALSVFGFYFNRMLARSVRRNIEKFERQNRRRVR